MELFTRLGELVRSLEADPATTNHPIKRQFLCDGEFLTANLAIVEEAGNALHTLRPPRRGRGGAGWRGGLPRR